MKRLFQGILAIVLCMAMLTGCAKTYDESGWDIGDRISEPRNLITPLEGTWEITRIVPLSEDKKTTPPYREGDLLYISEKLVGIKDYFTIRPMFSAKYVDTNEYLNTRYQKTPALEGFKSDNLTVVMVKEGDAFSAEFMKLSDQRICFINESNLFYLKRIDDKVSEEAVERYEKLAKAKSQKPYKDKERRDMAIYVGVYERKTDKNGIAYPTYYTYLIREDLQSPAPRVYLIENLLIPRKEGNFTTLGYEVVSKNEVNGVTEGKYTVGTIGGGEQEPRVMSDRQKRSVTYVHDGIVSFDKNIHPTLKGVRTYEILSLDQIGTPNAAPFTVEQIAGKAGKDSFHEQVMAQYRYLDPNGEADPKSLTIDDTNIGVERRNADWGFFTGLEVKVGNDLLQSRLPVDLVPVIPVYRSDKLQISWTRVYNQNNQATAAFTTPEQERLLIKDDDEIQYYRLRGENIETEPILSIQLSNSSKIVMMEVAYDKSAKYWEDTFLKMPLMQPLMLYNSSVTQDPYR